MGHCAIVVMGDQEHYNALKPAASHECAKQLNILKDTGMSGGNLPSIWTTKDLLFQLMSKW